MNDNPDLTFFTNEPDATLLRSVPVKTLNTAKHFDILVGYFPHRVDFSGYTNP